MRPIALQTLTWATVAAAVVSALWLAAVEPDQGSALRITGSPPAALPWPWPSEPAATGDAASRRADDPAAVRRRPQR